MLTYLLSAYFSTFYRTLCISQFQLRPAPPPPLPPGLLQGISPSFQSRGGAFANFALLGAGHLTSPGLFPALDTHAVSCQHITTQRILLEKNADWFICQGQGLVKACSQFYVRIFYGLSSQNYTTRNRELLTWINVFWLVNQISVDIFWRTSFHIYKTIHNIKRYDALLILMSIILY